VPKTPEPVARVAQLPSKPLLIYDGDCNFCRRWIERWRASTNEEVQFVPLQSEEVAARFPELRREDLEQAVHLVQPDGRVYRAAAAVFLALARTRQWPWWIYRRVPGAASSCEWAYRVVARHRSFFSLLTRLLWGQDPGPPSYFLVRAVFTRGLGLVYLLAFLSLGSQIEGLLGGSGILPASTTMQMAERSLGEVSWRNVLAEPTLCWWGSSDGALKLQCTAGVVLSLLVILGLGQAPCLLLLWGLYLSMSTVGDIFLGYQWDALLLETGLLAIFFSPLAWAGVRRELAPSGLTLALLRWLLFRLMFASGAVKLLSGDAMWHNLTALSVHYETQPLPTWLGWYVHQLPPSAHKVSCAAMFFIELGLPFLIVGPRRVRFVAFWAFVALQLVILLTGNYTFFNYLTLLLCVPLLDDQALLGLCPEWLQLRLGEARAWQHSERAPLARRLRLALTLPVACLIVAVTSVQTAALFHVAVPWAEPTARLYRWVAPFRSMNRYGLFAIMTTTRPEIIVEGSQDGQKWLAYEFYNKPGDLAARPRFVAPHQPRLDWQMWFAALGTVEDNPWFVNFSVRLLQGSPAVLRLLRHNPFSNAPPKYIRASLYEYHFTTASEREKSGHWWRREPKGVYCRPISLRPGEANRSREPER